MVMDFLDTLLMFVMGILTAAVVVCAMVGFATLLFMGAGLIALALICCSIITMGV